MSVAPVILQASAKHTATVSLIFTFFEIFFCVFCFCFFFFFVKEIHLYNNATDKNRKQNRQKKREKCEHN